MRSVEWQDAERSLKMAAYFDYEKDWFRNGTYRQVWVWNPALAEFSMILLTHNES